MKHSPTKHYPTEVIPFDGKLEPIKLSVDLLKLEVNVATDKYLDGLRNERYVQSYLSSFSINAKGHEQMIDNCQKMKALKYVNENENTNKEMKDLIISDSQTNGNKYERWRGEYIGIHQLVWMIFVMLLCIYFS